MITDAAAPLPRPFALLARPRLWLTRHCAGIGLGWLAISALIAILVLLPVLSLVSYALQGSGDLWPHLSAYVLPQALSNTLLLLVGVGAIVVTLGTGSAWLVTAYDFPGRGLLAWALLLPLAVPTYIVAFVYVDMLHPVGPVQSFIRDLFGVASPRDLRLADIRSMGGCILLLGLVLYPYVYLPVRAMFAMQAAGALEASRMLGASAGRRFFKVALPL
ncbi:MAG TPA: iron ABC transporter permease, partial [Cellvibrionaceae bacterium]